MWMIGGEQRIYLPPKIPRKAYWRGLLGEPPIRRKGNLPLFDFEEPKNLKKEGEYG